MTSPLAYVTGGTLAPDAPSYVERQADTDLFKNLLDGETCYVLNSRQMGKSSLCVRTIEKLKAQGIKTVFLDLTKFGGRNLTAEQWYAALLSEVGRELGLRTEFLRYWKENADQPPVRRLFGAITELGLDGGLVVFIDEIDVTLSLPFSTDEFLAAIRQCYVGRATDEKLKNLSFCLLGTATPADLIQDTRVSPFNIGKRIELKDFTQDEAAPLAKGLGDQTLLNRVLHWTGGHPYLTQRLCRAVQESETKNVDQVCSDLFLTHAAKDSDDNLAFVRNRLLKSEADLAALLDLYKKMRTGKPVPDDETNPLCALLKLSGVAKVEKGKLQVRNRIYEHVFDKNWTETHMPDAEVRRQKEAYRTGVWRTVGFAAVALFVVGSLAIYGFSSAQKARLAVTEAKRIASENARNLYYAKMNNLQLSDQEGDSGQIAQTLEETKDSPYKGWEWGYWNGVLHDADEEYVIDSPGRDVTQEATFSSDGSQILLRDQKLELAFLVDRKTRRKIGQYRLSRDMTAFSVDGRWLAYEYNQPNLAVSDLQSGKVVYRINNTNLPSQYIYPLENTKFLISQFNGGVNTDNWPDRLIDSRSGKVIPVRQKSTQLLSLVGASTSGDRLLIMEYTRVKGGFSQVLKVTDRVSGKDILTVPVPKSIRNCSLSPSGRRLAWCTERKILIEDLAEKRVTMSVDLPKQDLPLTVYFNKYENKLICGLQNGRVVVRSIADGKVTAEHRNVRTFSVNTHTGELLVGGRIIKVFRIDAGSNMWRPNDLSKQYPRIMRLSRDYLGRIVVDESDGNSVFLEDPSLRAIGKDPPNRTQYLSANGRLRLGIGLKNQTLPNTVRDARSGRMLLSAKLPWLSVEAPSEGEFFYVISANGLELVRYQYGSQQPVWTRKFEEPLSMALYVSRTGSRLLCTNKRFTLVIDGGSGQSLKTYPSRMSPLGFLRGTDNFCLGDNSEVHIVDAQTYTYRQSLKDADLGFDISPDGSRYVTSDNFGYISIWDAASGARLFRTQVGSSFSQGVLFTSDSKKVLAGEFDGPMRVYSSVTTDPSINIPVESEPTTPTSQRRK